MLILCDVRVKFDEGISQVFDVVSSDTHLLLVHVLAQFVIVLAYIFVVVLLFLLWRRFRRHAYRTGTK